jgi:hypothetical protein
LKEREKIGKDNKANKKAEARAFPKPRLVLGKALEKAAKSPLFPSKSKVAFPKLKFWESLTILFKIKRLLLLGTV